MRVIAPRQAARGPCPQDSHPTRTSQVSGLILNSRTAPAPTPTASLPLLPTGIWAPASSRPSSVPPRSCLEPSPSLPLGRDPCSLLGGRCPGGRKAGTPGPCGMSAWAPVGGEGPGSPFAEPQGLPGAQPWLPPEGTSGPRALAGVGEGRRASEGTGPPQPKPPGGRGESNNYWKGKSCCFLVE